MTDRQAQIDPWANIEAENMFPAVDALYYEADAVDKARAADAAQIASLTAQVEQQDEAFDIEREDATQWRIECGKAEAERDNQYQQAVEATQRALLAEQALADTEAERDAAQQEAQTLREALAGYMSAFGQGLEAHGIAFGRQQEEADAQARAYLSLPVLR